VMQKRTWNSEARNRRRYPGCAKTLALFIDKHPGTALLTWAVDATTINRALSGTELRVSWFWYCGGFETEPRRYLQYPL
jgi:hypothetical protein